MPCLSVAPQLLLQAPVEVEGDEWSRGEADTHYFHSLLIFWDLPVFPETFQGNPGYVYFGWGMMLFLGKQVSS